MSAGAKPGWAKGLRKEQRLAGCKPVTVLGQDKFGNAFLQNTFTGEISAGVARLQGLPPWPWTRYSFLSVSGSERVIVRSG